MVPEVAEVGQQFVAVFPEVEIEGVEVMVAAPVGGIQQGQAAPAGFAQAEQALGQEREHDIGERHLGCGASSAAGAAGSR